MKAGPRTTYLYAISIIAAATARVVAGLSHERICWNQRNTLLSGFSSSYKCQKNECNTFNVLASILGSIL